MSFNEQKENDRKDLNSIYDVKSPLELKEIYKNEPEPEFYWRGIEDTSFGFIFGPSKSGKTIFSENLAIKLSVGKNDFFNSNLSGKPKKIFVANFEENYRNRTRRMIKQISVLNEEELELFNDNLTYSGPNFPRFLYTKNDWKEFEKLIIIKKPDVLIIDSFTRIVNTDITNRDACKKVLARLRNFAYDNNLCMIIIHHSTKLSGGPLVMDSMAGSSVISQEADFAIGLNRNGMTNSRYLKEIFYRYEEPKEMVTRYTISNDSNWLIPGESVFETKIVSNTGEKSASYYDLIVNYLQLKANNLKLEDNSIDSYEIESSELKKEFVSNSTIPSRSFDYTLRNVVGNGVLKTKGRKGNYLYSINSEQLTQVAQVNEE